jgi:hypothetical protein
MAYGRTRQTRRLWTRALRVVPIIDLLLITKIDVRRGLKCAVIPVASALLSRIVVPIPISLEPSLITEHHSVSSLNDLAGEAR